MRCFVLSLLIFSAMLNAFAQDIKEDVVYLKNGNVLRGQITELKPEESVRIRLVNGMENFHQMSEVLKLTREARFGGAQLAQPNGNPGRRVGGGLLIGFGSASIATGWIPLVIGISNGIPGATAGGVIMTAGGIGMITGGAIMLSRPGRKAFQASTMRFLPYSEPTAVAGIGQVKGLPQFSSGMRLHFRF